MGRKPNPLILEFFERGPKIGDQSNRYQHTCKRCGEVVSLARYRYDLFKYTDCVA